MPEVLWVEGGGALVDLLAEAIATQFGESPVFADVPGARRVAPPTFVNAPTRTTLPFPTILARGLHTKPGTARAVPYAEIPRIHTRIVAPHPLPRTLDALPARARAGFLRWARHVTGRRVGVALGGGGAWGFGSVAVLQALLDRGVPVDFVAGSSSGALVGAWYGAYGAEGLEALVRRGRTIERALPLMTLSTRPAELLVDADLGGMPLEHLEIPVLPVATDTRTLRPVVFTEGSTGFACRASVSAPGLFATTDTFVDGAVSDNAPFRPLEAAGAALVLAANPLPAEAASPSRSSAFFHAFSGMMHAAGTPEANPRRVVYAAPPVRGALTRLLRYGDAARIVAQARRDPALTDAVEAMAEAWRALAAPRVLDARRPPSPARPPKAGGGRDDARAREAS